jgi:hypothetical protein
VCNVHSLKYQERHHGPPSTLGRALGRVDVIFPPPDEVGDPPPLCSLFDTCFIAVFAAAPFLDEAAVLTLEVQTRQLFWSVTASRIILCYPGERSSTRPEREGTRQPHAGAQDG